MAQPSIPICLYSLSDIKKHCRKGETFLYFECASGTNYLRNATIKISFFNSNQQIESQVADEC